LAWDAEAGVCDSAGPQADASAVAGSADCRGDLVELAIERVQACFDPRRVARFPQRLSGLALLFGARDEVDVIAAVTIARKAIPSSITNTATSLPDQCLGVTSP
jgi:hypothetical protein